MKNLKVNHYVVGMVQTNCYVAYNDETKEINGFACDDALEGFYEDDTYTYYWSCIKNKYMIVKYDDGSKELISEALEKKHIDIQMLDKFNISYIKEEK